MTVKEAIEYANTGETVKLISDVTIYEAIEIKEAITLELNGKKVTSTAKDAFRVSADATIQNGTIEGANRCINTRDAVVLTLENVNLKAETIETIDQKATSLSVLTDRNYEIEPILNGLCDRFFENYDLFVQKGFSYIKERYEQRCNFIGKNIRIREMNGTKEYFAKAITDDGLLLVENDLGSESKIITGDLLC